jgi:hypothetical protein
MAEQAESNTKRIMGFIRRRPLAVSGIVFAVTIVLIVIFNVFAEAGILCSNYECLGFGILSTLLVSVLGIPTAMVFLVSHQ